MFVNNRKLYITLLATQFVMWGIINKKFISTQDVYMKLFYS